jgi:hypothetical protein
MKHHKIDEAFVCRNVKSYGEGCEKERPLRRASVPSSAASAAPAMMSASAAVATGGGREEGPIEAERGDRASVSLGVGEFSRRRREHGE